MSQGKLVVVEWEQNYPISSPRRSRAETGARGTTFVETAERFGMDEDLPIVEGMASLLWLAGFSLGK